MRKIYLSIIGTVLLACSTITAWAIVPPPPVNQNLGIPDTQFQILFDTVGTNTCKRCHRPDDLLHGLPQPNFLGAEDPILMSRYLPTRHHMHVGPSALRGGLIAGGPEQPPEMDVDGDGNEDTVYSCLSCHQIMPIGPNGGVTENHRNCSNCHILTMDDPANPGGPQIPRPSNKPRTVHHDTPKAFRGECGNCHGWLIRSLDVGRPAPTWLPSIITPWPSGKDAQDDTVDPVTGDYNNQSSALTFPGNCDYCHNSVDASSAGTLDDTSEFSQGFGPGGTLGAIRIYQNKQNHHATGVPWITEAESTGAGAGKLPAGATNACEWCHFDVLGFPAGYVVRTDPDGNPIESVETWAIRGCQRCHDIPSLHAIEADVDGDGVVPGAESAYNGHIGNQDNCWGCHGFNPDGAPDVEAQSMLPYPVQAVVAQLDAVNAIIWPQGTGFDNLTLAGQGFENQGEEWDYDNGYWIPRYYMPSVQLTHQSGDVTILEPTSSDKSRIVVAVPADLAAGGYDVQVKKGDSLSNPLRVNIIPSINSGPAICLARFGIVLIRGNGFNEYFSAAPSSVTGVTDANGQDASTIYFWKDNMVAARFSGGCPEEIEINNVFGSTTVTPLVW